MKTLILPVAGQSSRFPKMRPKWLLTMPDGKLMIEKAVELIDLAVYDRVIVVALREHLDDYLTGDSLEQVLAGIKHPRVEVCVLEGPTASQSETVALALEKSSVTGAFFIKDCDNMFRYRWGGGNEVATLDLNHVNLIDAKNKSYVDADALDNISNIVEKRVISNVFCCGGYGFRSADLFVKHFKSLNSSDEIYISHVIYSMLMEGEHFTKGNASSYVDWGTLREYRHYTRNFITLFCDVDGVLFYNGSKFSKNGWHTEPIIENLKTISQLQENGTLYLVITSSRPESEIEYVRFKLAEFNVRPDRYVMGLPHTRRVLVNDYSATNPFPTSIAVNLERDGNQLSDILSSICE